MPETSTCPSAEEWGRFIRDEYPPVVAAALRQHLARCRVCSDSVNRLRSAGVADAPTQGGNGAATPTLPPSAPATHAPANTSTVPHKPYAFLDDPQQSDEIGRLGHYRVLKVLGAGGMGVVFLAEDIHLERRVALKAMLPDAACHPQLRERFLREARATAAIEHEHIVTIHQVGPDGPVPYLAMQLLHGESLEDCLRREGRLPLKEVLRIGREIAAGLAAAHERGLIHRDIKPSNVWLEARQRSEIRGQRSAGGGLPPRVKIVDFGLAKVTQSDVRLTQAGAVMGTPWYMAPEQASGQDVDGRCDLFSLGCVLYRMATGHLPFKGNEPMSVMVKVVTEEPLAPKAVAPDLPAAVNELILRLLIKEPRKRPGSARKVAEVLARLEHALAAAKPSVRPARSAEPATEPLPAVQPPRRRRWLVATTLAALLVLTAFGVAQRSSRFKNWFRSAPTSAVATQALSDFALVTQPAVLPGVLGWTVETRGHRGVIRVLAYSPDGSRLASAGNDGTVRLWDAKSDRLERILVGHDSPVVALAWSPDGGRLASVGGKALRLWEAATGKPVGGWEVAQQPIAWSPDGTTIACGGPDETIQLRGVATGEIVRTLQAQTGEVHTLAWSPDGKILAWGGENQTLRVLALQSTQPPIVGKRHKGAIAALAFSADSKLLATAARDGTLNVWQVAGAKHLQSYSWNYNAGPNRNAGFDRGALAWSPREPLLAAISAQGTTIWKPDSAKPFRTHASLKGHSLTWSVDGARLAGTGAGESGTRICDAATGQVVATLPGQREQRPLQVHWSPDGRFCGVYGGDTLSIWETATGGWHSSLPRFSRRLRTFAWSPDSRRLAYLFNGDKTVTVWDVVAKKSATAYTATAAQVITSLAWSPDGKQLALGTSKPTGVIVWRLGTDDRVFTLPPHEGPALNALAWSPDGALLAAGGDSYVKLWRVAVPRLERELRPFAGAAQSLAWSRDGKYLASSTTNTEQPVRIWDAARGRLLHDWKDHTGPGRELRWLDDGKTLAQALNNGEVFLWDAESGKQVRAFPARIGRRHFLPEQGLLATWSFGFTLRLQDLATDAVCGTLAWSPDDKDAYLYVSHEGHWRASPSVEPDAFYVVQTAEGFDLLTPAAFETKYGWKNDRSKVQLASAKSVAKR